MQILVQILLLPNSISFTPFPLGLRLYFVTLKKGVNSYEVTVYDPFVMAHGILFRDKLGLQQTS